jgi:hypothetical protein
MPIFKCLTNLFVFVACLAFFVGCAPVEENPDSESPEDTSEEMVVSEPLADEEPDGITADSLVGSTWAIADYSVTFEGDGVVSFNSGSKGSWSLIDETITIGVADEETIISVDGDQLMHDGMALERQ